MLTTLIGAGLIGLTVIGFCQSFIESGAKGKTFDHVDAVPNGYAVGLVLGTNPETIYQTENLFYRYRIEAAAALYKSGKVEHLIVSGDNSRKDYDEPTQMRDDLTQLDVPGSAITIDYAGFRTLDSVVRAKVIFKRDRLCIVSQAFHNKRAIAIAERYDIDAVGYNATLPSVGKHVQYREYLARVKALIDLYITGKAPKYLGKTIDLPL